MSRRRRPRDPLAELAVVAILFFVVGFAIPAAAALIAGHARALGENHGQRH